MRDSLVITSVHRRYVHRYVSTQGEGGKEKLFEGGEGNPNQAPACLKFVLAKSKPDITGEELNTGANTTSDMQLDIVARGLWERQR